MAHDVVLVSDRVKSFKGANVASKYLEHADDDYFSDVYGGLCSIASKVTHYDNPGSFIDNAAKHEDSIVMSIWSGMNSRNRKALVPAVCEARGIAYVGADPYFQLISADKQIAKIHAQEYGIESACGMRIDSKEDIEKIRFLTAPLVVKPNFEGGSIGIFQRSYAESFEDAEAVCVDLLRHYPSILAEEYIEGDEVNICLVGNKREIQVSEVCLFERDEGRRVFGAEEKKIRKSVGKSIVERGVIPDDVWNASCELFQHSGKVDILRIDGKVKDGQFKMLELSPDCSLRRGGAIARACAAAGMDYPEALQMLLDNAVIDR